MASTALGFTTLALLTLGFLLAVPLVLLPVIAGALWYSRRHRPSDPVPTDAVVVHRGATAQDDPSVRPARAA